MKILLTGQPHSGKTTLLARLLASVSQKQGFVTQEIPDPGHPGQRFGFHLVDADQNTAILAHVDNPSTIRVSKYGVDVEALDKFIEPLFNYSADQLLYIDEIGQMELFSTRFKELVNSYLASPNHFIGTITSVYDDEFIRQIKGNPDIEVITITLENRAEVYEQIYSKLTGV